MGSNRHHTLTLWKRPRRVTKRDYDMTIPSSMRSRAIDTPAYFSAAVLVTIMMSAAIWLLSSQFIQPPAAADVAKRFGLRPAMVHIVKPEPVEKATFMLSAVFGVLAFSAAAISRL